MKGAIAGIMGGLFATIAVIFHFTGAVSRGVLATGTVLLGMPFIFYNLAYWSLKDSAGDRFAC